jgi:hypothetical protein
MVEALERVSQFGPNNAGARRSYTVYRVAEVRSHKLASLRRCRTLLEVWVSKLKTLTNL